MGKLSKQVFKHFAESACDRRLFLELGEGDARWMSPLRTLEPRDPSAFGHRDDLLALGHNYEEEVYRALIAASPLEVRYDRSSSGSFNPCDLSPSLLDELVDRLDEHGRLCLIEHEFKAPSLWPRTILDLEPHEQPPFDELSHTMRPDLTLLVRADEFASARGLTRCARLTSSGDIVFVEHDVLERMVALRILDVKHTHDQQVGASHFIELLVYTHALAAFLEAHGLDDRFFVPIMGHGIVPRLGTSSAWTGVSVASLDAYLVPLDWDGTAHLYGRVVERIRTLHRPNGVAAPRSVESIEVNIQPNCGRCLFLEDCKQSLGMSSTDPGEWDVRLLPYTSRSIGQQLRARGIHTIEEVVNELPTSPHSATPEPLDAERPVVMLKANALLAGEALPAAPEHTGGERHQTVALPQYTNIELVFDVETDPTHNVVFATALDLTFSSNENLSWASYHNIWWLFWMDVIEGGMDKDSADWEHLVDALNAQAVDLEFDNSTEDPERRGRYIRKVGKAFFNALTSFTQDPQATIDIRPPGGEAPWGALKTAEVHLSWNYVSGGTSNDDELVLAQQLVRRLHELLLLCHVTETLTRSYHFEDRLNKRTKKMERRSWTQGPAFAGLYWSTEQLVHAGDLLERHVNALIEAEDSRDHLLGILHWLSPTESAVDHPLRHKKIYDLRTFAETAVGFPRIINYSWHELAFDEFGFSAATRFWAPHFNYMDFAPWRAMVLDTNLNTKIPLLEEIRGQITGKASTIRRLLSRLRDEGRGNFAQGSRYPERTAALRASKLPAQTHALGKAWYAYSRLNAATAELAADAFIATYPSFSIGKLAAGEAQKIGALGDERLSFELHGLSTNVKMKPGDYIYLIPDDMRGCPGAHLNSGWRVRVDAMTWRTEDASYLVETHSVWPKHKLLTGDAMLVEGQPWYVFQTASDAWSGKLLKLLQRSSFGVSWLGHRLSSLLDIGQGGQVDEPAAWRFESPAVYAFAPSVLPEVEHEPTRPLLSTVVPAPDTSQSAAISFALSRTISCLQGPPGTGKSQTIATLIDEYLHRRGGQPARILVTAFSYAALEVVCQKVATAQTSTGSAAAVASQHILFARSSSRQPASITTLDHVDDLVVGSKSLVLNGEKLSLARAKGEKRSKRLEDYVEEGVILFANAHQLFHLGEESTSKSMQYNLLGNDFGFDLIIVDEASQLPADYMLAPLALVKPHEVELACDVTSWPTSSLQGLRSLHAEECPALSELTQVVIVGDDQQLPPVQTVKPPEKLKRALDSVFTYYVEGHRVGRRQLQVNYRSLPEIVAFTRELNLYDNEISSYFAEHPEALRRIAPVEEGLEPSWCTPVIEPSFIVGTIIHARAYDSAVSAIEAEIVADLVEAYFRHVQPKDREEEDVFWGEEVGIVSPHNAHGRLLVRTIASRLTREGERLTNLSDAELLAALGATVYSVEKFQGSDRTFIIASMGISSVDQLAAEEEFIYDRNRFNVLTSRAKQKMLLVCSQNFLDHVPRDRTIMQNAAHIRCYALEYCSEQQDIAVLNERGEAEDVLLRWYPKGVVLQQEAPPSTTPPTRGTQDLQPVVRVLVGSDELLSKAQVLELLDPEMGEAWWSEFEQMNGLADTILVVGRRDGRAWIGREKALGRLVAVLQEEGAPVSPEAVCQAAGLRTDLWPKVEKDLELMGLWPRHGVVVPPQLPEHLRALKQEHADGQIQILELIQRLVAVAEREGSDSLSEVLEAIKSDHTPILLSRFTEEMDELKRIASMPEWKMDDAGVRHMQKALKTLFRKYHMHDQTDLVHQLTSWLGMKSSEGP